MKLLSMLVLSRLRKQKTRLAFVMLAITAASCLVVWMIGGYQTLFSEIAKDGNNYLGWYDLKIGGPNGGEASMFGRGGGPGFGGPFGQMGGKQAPAAQNLQKYDPYKSARTDQGDIDLNRLPSIIPEHIRTRLKNADKDQNGILDEKERADLRPEKKAEDSTQEMMTGMGMGMGGMPGGGRGRNVPPLPEKLIQELKEDPSVAVCDEYAFAMAFIYFPKTVNMTIDHSRTDVFKTTENKGDERSAVPEGIDPALHQAGLNAYRATMGTPMGLGQRFAVTNAVKPPYDLQTGRWFDSADPTALEVVLPAKTAEKWKAVPGDHVLFITPSREIQLEVVGIISDPLFNCIYTTFPTAEKILGTVPKTSSLLLKLKDNIVLDDYIKNLLKDHKELQSMAASTENQPVPGNRMQEMSGRDNTSTSFLVSTEANMAAQRAKERAEANRNIFHFQAISGSLLAVLASIFIIFTAMNMSVEEQKRQLALYRAVGVTRMQLARGILFESLILAIPGWLGGLTVGWLILCLGTGNILTPNNQMILYSFICSVFGAVIASFLPMIKGCRVKPMEAVLQTPLANRSAKYLKHRKILLGISTLLGMMFIVFDLLLVYVVPIATEKKALVQSGVGVLALILGTVLLIPFLVRLAEVVFIPIFALLFRVNPNLIRTELSANLGRTTGTVIALSVGLGLYFSMQIWGYSMLGPFLPNNGMPEAFAAFLPTGLEKESIEQVKKLPYIKSEEFEPVALEQASFTDGSIKTKGGMGDSFANVILFGMNIERTFRGNHPLVTLRFVQGVPEEALNAMAKNKGVVINDSVSIDYGLNLGDILTLNHPTKSGIVLKYPIVGVIKFDGWQWLSKTSGVRRHFGRSGGIVFANNDTVWNDFGLDRYSYFWFNTNESKTLSEMESDFDKIARDNFTLLSNKESGSGKTHLMDTNAAYAKISTRASLRDSISNRADGVIWGISVMPLVTLMITSIAVFGVVTNSVRARRWQFGMMRSVGVSNGSIVRMIIMEALLIGLITALVSFLFGWLAAAGALKLGKSMFGSIDPPLIFPIKGLLIGFGTAFGLCMIAALWPAIQTGRKKPLELLQEGRGT